MIAGPPWARRVVCDECGAVVHIVDPPQAWARVGRAPPGWSLIPDGSWSRDAHRCGTCTRQATERQAARAAAKEER